ncbi:MAG: SUMF1/EgtB/PvdO family nonheme iron enzyme [Bacteroidota bacterium]
MDVRREYPKKCTNFAHIFGMIGRVILILTQTFLFTFVGCHPKVGDAHTTLSVSSCLIPAGAFMMGDSEAEPNAQFVHRVELDAFLMDATPVTYKDFRRYVEAGGRKNAYWDYETYHQDNQPVTGISWYRVIDYCNWRSAQEGFKPAYYRTDQKDEWGYPIWKRDITANGYRLPTEAEFEYAARGGLEDKKFPWGDKFDPFKANHDNERGFRFGKWRLAQVTQQYQNPYGLYGMSGNVWEWCDDWYASGYYEQPDNNDNPTGASSGATKVLRGGSWGSINPDQLAVYARSYSTPANYNYDIGFRCVRSVSTDNEVGEIKPHVFRSNPKPIHHEPIRDLYGGEMRQRLTKFIAQNYPNCLYLHESVDEQPKLTPQQLADLLVDVTEEHGIHPLFLTGIITAESGFASCSFPRWFNSPMAYEWQNRLMDAGIPEYNAPLAKKNRKYRDLREGFTAFCEGLQRKPWYKEVAQKDLYAFHKLYVGYEAEEWMRTLTRVYREVGGVRLEAHYPSQNVGAFIFTPNI